MTNLSEVRSLLNRFNIILIAAGKKTSPADACSCWTNSSLNQTVEAAKVCKASSEATAITAALKKCKKAFGKCRKFEDAAITTIMSCSSDTGKLTEKAASLQKNVDSVKAAQAKVKALSSSRGTGAASNCTEVVKLVAQLINLVEQFPSSPSISVYSKKITEAANVTCAEDEKSSLAALEENIEAAADSIANEVAVIQEQLLTLTGTSISASLLTASSLNSAATLATSAGTNTTWNTNTVPYCLCNTGMLVSSLTQIPSSSSAAQSSSSTSGQ